jgi:hypothetical protein
MSKKEKKKNKEQNVHPIYQAEKANWYIVDASVKKSAHLNVISHSLSLIPYEDLTPEHLELPPRQEAGDFQYPDISQSNIVPAIYP